MAPIKLLLRSYWRVTRGTTLGAQAAIFDDHQHLLLVRHRYVPGWHFPGGGVEWNETVEQAVTREAYEEAGVRFTQTPVLHGVFANFRSNPGDHIAFFVARDWCQAYERTPDHEIAEHGFFALDALPDGTVDPVRRRLAEIIDGVPLSADW